MKSVLSWINRHAVTIWLTSIFVLVIAGNLNILVAFAVAVVVLLIYIESHLRRLATSVD